MINRNALSLTDDASEKRLEGTLFAAIRGDKVTIEHFSAATMNSYPVKIIPDDRGANLASKEIKSRLEPLPGWPGHAGCA